VVFLVSQILTTNLSPPPGMRDMRITEGTNALPADFRSQEKHIAQILSKKRSGEESGESSDDGMDPVTEPEDLHRCEKITCSVIEGALDLRVPQKA